MYYPADKWRTGPWELPADLVEKINTIQTAVRHVNYEVKAHVNISLEHISWFIECVNKYGDNLPIASFTLAALPGQCGVAISTAASVSFNYSRKGLGTMLNLYRQDLARQMGYTVLLCTDVVHNRANQKVLKKAGWKEIYQFVNRRSHNPVSINVVPLYPT